MHTNNNYNVTQPEINLVEIEKLLTASDAPYDEQCFAMLHCGSAIRNSQWEGGSYLRALEYIQKLINLAEPFFDSGLSESQLSAINLAFEEVIFFHHLFKRFENSKTGEFNIDLKIVVREIATRCENKGVCYLPSGWTGEKSGHFAILKLQNHGTHYTASILNLGAGVKFHRPLSQGKHKLKRDYQSYEYAINLDSAPGEFFLTSLIHLLLDRRPFDKRELEVRQEKNHDGSMRSIRLPSNNKTINPFSETDLYSLLVLCGKKIKSSPALATHAVTIQRTGICTITSTKLLIRDVLITQFSATAEEIKRVNFAIKVNSLPGGYQASCYNHANQELLLWALREFHVRVLKHYPQILSPKELTVCNQVGEFMLTRLKKENDQKIQEKCQRKPLPPLKGSWNKTSHQALIENPQKVMEKKITPMIIKEEKQLDCSSCQPENMVNYLDQALEYFKDNRDIAGLMKLRQFMHTLEKTSGEKKDEYWDQLSESCAQAVIDKLTQLIAYNVTLDAKSQVYKFEIALIAYDIAAQLAPRITALKFNGQITLCLDDVFSDQTFYFDAVSYHTIKQIVLNFMQREKDNEYRIFSNAVNVDENDRTQDYIIQLMLTQELRQQVINLLKDKEIIESGESTIEDDLLFSILMTKKCEKRGGEKKTFETEKIFDKTLMNIMSLSGTVHARGKSVTVYEKQDKYSNTLYFNKNNFHKKMELGEVFSQLSEVMYDSPASTELMKKFPDLGRNSGSSTNYMDFAENTIFHPYEDLVKTRKDLLWSKKMPYVVNTSGSLLDDRLPYPCPQIDEEIDEELRSIETSPSLQVQRILEWGQYNIEKLKIDYIRMRCYQLLFQFGRLDIALADAQEETITLIQKFLEKGFEFYHHRQDSQFEFSKDNPIDVILWLSHIRQHVIQYIKMSATLYQQPLNELNLVDNKPILMEKIKTSRQYYRSALACQLALCFRGISELTTEDAVTLLMANLLYHLNYLHSSNETQIAADDGKCLFADVWEKHRESVFALLVNMEKSKLSQLINQLMKDLHLIHDDVEWIIEGDRITTKNMDYTINLKTGQLTENTNIKTDHSRLLVNNLIFSSLALDKNKLILWRSDGGIYKTPDGKWEFHALRPDTITEIYQTVSVEDNAKRFKLLYKNGFTYGEITQHFDSKKINNPFQTLSLGDNFTYWVAVDDEDIIFVESQKQDAQYAYLKTTKHAWVQLKKTSHGWQRTNQVFFDLDNPQTALEKQWSERLSPLFGLPGIKVIAELDQYNECVIKQITIERLGLSFTHKNDRLECDNFTGFYLSERQSTPDLKGLPVIVLENEDGKEKYLLPPFNLKKVEGNSIFQYQDFLDKNKLHLSYRFPSGKLACYVYELDHQQQLISNHLEANLYLALVYRCQGDYLKAMQALERTSHHKNNHEELYDMIEMLTQRQDQSALGAAFDCKLACRMLNHVGKWSEASDKVWNDTKIEKKFLIFSIEQFDYYQQTISDYKNGIHIIPLYLRLTEEEMAMIENMYSNMLGKKQSFHSQTIKRTEKEPVLNEMHMALANVRIEEANLTFLKNYNNEGGLNSCIRDFGFDDKRHCFQKNQRSFSLRTYYDYTNIELNNQADGWGCSHLSNHPGYDYLKVNFINYFEEARSSSLDHQQQLKLEWNLILQNDASYHSTGRMIALLLFVMENPFLFKGIKIHDGMTSSECCQQVVKQCIYSVYTEKREQTTELIHAQGEYVEFTQRNTLPTSFPQEKALSFHSPHTESHKALFSLLQNLALAHFLPARMERVAKREVLFAKDKRINANRENTLLENYLLAHYEEGHAENLKKQKTIYRMPPSCNLSFLVDELIGKRDLAQKSLITMQETLRQSAYKIPDSLESDEQSTNKTASDLLAVANKGEQLYKIETLLVSALSSRDVTQLNASNPWLNQNELDLLLNLQADLLMLQSHIDQINSALELLLEKGKPKSQLSLYEQQLLGSILNKSRYYSVEEFPEFLVYECATKRLLRSDQVEVLKNLIACIEKEFIDAEEVHHALLQFEAGGGKTSVIIPILAHRFARMGFLPVIINTSELYNIGIEDIPQSLKASLKQNLEVLERELDHVWTIKEFEKLLMDLERYRKDKKVLLIKAITWHSIHIASQIAYLENNVELADSAQKVLDFFKEKAVKLEDECQIVSDPLQESIKTYGPMQTMPLEQQQLFMHFYSYLLGYAEGCQHLAEKAGIINKSKNIINETTLETIQTTLVDKILEEDFFSQFNKSELKKYFLQTNKQRPDWLKSLYKTNQDKAELIVLARAFIKTHLPYIFTLQAAKDYGKSIHSGDLTVAPKDDEKDMTSHYSDQALVMALTIQLYAQEGIPESHLKLIIERCETSHIQERKWNKAETESDLFLKSLLPVEYSGFSLDTMTETEKNKICQDVRVLHHPLIIQDFLYHYALPQIKTPKFRVKSTPADLQAGHRLSIDLSATPGPKAIHSAFLKKLYCFFQKRFEAEVLDTLLQEKNSTACLIEMTNSADDFFNQLRTYHSESFNEMMTLIDRGALLSNDKAIEVITSYLSATKVKNAYYSAVCLDKGQMLLRSNDPDIKASDTPGSDLMSLLKSLNVQPETFLLFLFLALADTTGIDIKRPYTDRAGVTLGKELTITQIIQAVMRERQLLWDDAQTVFWIMFRILYQEIKPQAEYFDLDQEIKPQAEYFDLESVFLWAIGGEAKQLESKIVMRVYQGIDREIESIVRSNRKKYQEYSEKLQKSFSLSAWNNYEIESEMYESILVLNDYIDERCDDFNLDREKLPLPTQERLALLIEETTCLIKEMQQPKGVELNSQVHQEEQTYNEQQQKQQIKETVKSIVDSSHCFKFNLEIYGDRDNLDTIFSEFRYRYSDYQQLALSGCKRITLPSLLIRPQDFHPLKSDRNFSNDTIEALKPIKILLVRMTNNADLRFLACTSAGAEFLYQQINHSHDQENNSCYAFIGMNGKILFSSKNMSCKQKAQLRDSELVQEYVTFVSFLNGQVNNPRLLSQMIKKYGWSKEDYITLTNAITKIHVSRCPMNLHNIATLEKLCGWKKQDSQFLFFKKSNKAEQITLQNKEASIILSSEIPLPKRSSHTLFQAQPCSVLPECVLGKTTTARMTIFKEGAQRAEGGI